MSKEEIFSILVSIIKSRVKSIYEIVVFGSYAKGIQNIESDVDIAIIIQNKISRKMKLKLLNDLWLETAKVGLDVDLIIKTLDDYRKEQKIFGTIANNIFNEGNSLWKMKLT
ncbi:MAG TPA: nucleotidyltransferase domain-containing protein [Candidatus Cloacimonetes bacterium]|nr:nucleotidyltransferase domain-containing protein [Candidatus Cloacimonadota bacterium]